MAAAAVDGEFWCVYASFELTLKCPGMLWGLHCAPFVSLWGTFGALWCTLGNLGAHVGPPVAALGRQLLWDALGLFWASLEKKCPLGHPSQADGSQVPRLRTKTSLLEFARRSRRSWRNGPRTTIQDLPSTRAGDQDDVSFTNSLKLYIYICFPSKAET